MPPSAPTDRSRDAAAAAAVDLLAPGVTIGLGSGRGVWRIVELIAARWPDGAPLRAACASPKTGELARTAGADLISLDGETVLDVMLDGADELDDRLRLIKGGGGALLREKLLACAARTFVIVAESTKRVERLGRRFRLPVEVVRFASEDTALRVQKHLAAPEVRRRSDGVPFVTDEGHLILDCSIPSDADLDLLPSRLSRVPGVVEHGLFIGMTDIAVLGSADRRGDSRHRSVWAPDRRLVPKRRQKAPNSGKSVAQHCDGLRARNPSSGARLQAIGGFWCATFDKLGVTGSSPVPPIRRKPR
jgi:ribose 5-phosphate isomerase A